jgi:hypothetical protein
MDRTTRTSSGPPASWSTKFCAAQSLAISVEQPTKFDLTIDMVTPKALGITVPRMLLGRADEVIE